MPSSSPPPAPLDPNLSVGPVAELKRRLREEMSRRRQACSPAFTQSASAALVRNLLSVEAFKTAPLLAGFQAVRGEIDPGHALHDRERNGAVVAWPRVSKARPRLMFHRACKANDWTSGAFGLQEPVASAPVVPTQALSAILVPGLAFDENGGRLGWGGGFYDEVLGTLPPMGKPLLLGVAYDFQIIACCPVEPLDVFLDWVVTDQRVIECSTPKPLTERSS